MAFSANPLANLANALVTDAPDTETPAARLERHLLGLVRLCHVDGVGDVDLRLQDVVIDGVNTGDWHLTLRLERA